MQHHIQWTFEPTLERTAKLCAQHDHITTTTRCWPHTDLVDKETSSRLSSVYSCSRPRYLTQSRYSPKLQASKCTALVRPWAGCAWQTILSQINLQVWCHKRTQEDEPYYLFKPLPVGMSWNSGFVKVLLASRPGLHQKSSQVEFFWLGWKHGDLSDVCKKQQKKGRTQGSGQRCLHWPKKIILEQDGHDFLDHWKVYQFARTEQT